MNLAEFVSETLTQIATGVRDARKHTGLMDDVAINPCGANYYPGVQNISFDVAVTTTESGEGGAKISVLGLSAGGEVTTENSTVSRIKFNVPMQMPYEKLDEPRLSPADK